MDPAHLTQKQEGPWYNFSQLELCLQYEPQRMGPLKNIIGLTKNPKFHLDDK